MEPAGPVKKKTTKKPAKPAKHACATAKEGPNAEPIAVCDVTKPADNEVLRIMGTRIGFREDGQREFLVKLKGLKALEWLTNNNMVEVDKKLDYFKRRVMAWSDWPEEEGREFMVQPTKAVKPAYPTAKAGPNGEPIAKQCDQRPDIASIRRILGTRFGYVDNNKHEYLVKVDGKDELVWLQEAHVGEFRQLIDAYKKETREPHLRRKIGIEYFVGRYRDSPLPSGLGRASLANS
ncbi:hypothetical protein AAVH_15856 [Aphelenchoides avenae]|nr:hypothetical protein AAVH_15856 [Aphelenchus avenae]